VDAVAPVARLVEAVFEPFIAAFFAPE